MFSPNDSFLYILTAVVLVIITGQSVFFLVRAMRRAKAIGIPMATLKKNHTIQRGVYHRASRCHLTRRDYPV